MKRGFEEADQERLFLSTHAGATSGKQGLGIADRTKKVAGARWGGSKKAFGEEEEGEGDAAEVRPSRVERDPQRNMLFEIYAKI